MPGGKVLSSRTAEPSPPCPSQGDHSSLGDHSCQGDHSSQGDHLPLGDHSSCAWLAGGSDRVRGGAHRSRPVSHQQSCSRNLRRVGVEGLLAV